MIFNSLGSNYNFEFVVKSLFSFPSKRNKEKLISLLQKKYGGKVVLLYKGREAIKLALELSRLPKGSKIGVNGFTCYVVYQAIVEAGYKPVYLDINGRSLNFDVNNLERYKEIRALIIQNTLGNPVDIISIESFCNKNNILIIEDLAHSAGGSYSDGTKVGTAGDFTALSFSQDKIIDAVSGGALIIRNIKFENLNKIKYENQPLGNQIRDRFYPLLTFKIRKLYPSGIGKYFHYVIKHLKILSDPMGGMNSIKYHYLPNWYSLMALLRLSRLDMEIEHRRAIAKIYSRELNPNIISSDVKKNCEISTNIRFPIFVENRKSLIFYLKNNGIFISDIWYDAPVAPSKLIGKTDYNGSCPESEKISKQILNLPTHINVSRNDAAKISALINKWQNTNRK